MTTTPGKGINQDDVLGGGGNPEDDLSPSEFGTGSPEGGGHGNPTGRLKATKTLLPMIAGIAVAILIVAIFAWKILSPHFGNDRGGSDRDTFAPISAAGPRLQPQPFGPEPAAPAGGAGVTPMAAGQPVALPGSPVPPGASSDPMPPGGTAQGQPPAPLPVQISDPSKSVMVGAGSSPMPLLAAPAASADDLAQINKRIDGLTTGLASLKEAVEKLQADMKSRTPTSTAVPAKPAPAVAAAKPAAPPAPKAATPTPAPAAKKPAAPTAPAAKKPGDGAKDTAAAEAKPAEVQLSAVLQGRAWFKTKTGETITVAPGDELKGYGVVKQIDVDTGRVTMSNGMVFH